MEWSGVVGVCETVCGTGVWVLWSWVGWKMVVTVAYLRALSLLRPQGRSAQRSDLTLVRLKPRAVES